MMGSTTNRARATGTPGAIGGDRRLRRPPWARAPFAAVALSLLALAAPNATLAPLLAPQPTSLTGRVAALVPERRPLPARDAAPVVDPAREVRRYQAALEEARSRVDAPGVTFAVVRDGELVWEGSTGTTRDGRNMATDERLVIGSVTKTFVAAVVLQLVADGTLELDGSVRQYLPGLISISPDITIAQLLNHTSGLADLFNEATRVGLETDVGHAWTSDEVLGTLGEPWYAPGEAWAYSNTNYLLLTLIVEEVTGEPLESVIATRITGPLGLGSTTVLSGGDGEPMDPAWATIFRGSGAMVSTAADLARWGDALFAGPVLPAGSRREMLDFNEDDYGLGLQRIELGGLPGYGHTGLLNTDTTLLLHVPSSDVTVALIANRARVDLDLMMRAHPAEFEPSLLELATERRR